MSHPAEHDRRDNATAAAARPGEENASPWVAGIIAVALLISTVVFALGYWRKGAFAAGCCFALAGLARLVLPERYAGVLVVRKKWFDTAIMLGAGIVIAVLALIVPPMKP